MREILFKAKVKDWEQKPKDEQWVYGYYVRGFDIYEEPIHMIFDPTTIFYSHGETDGWDEIDPETLCQYTGLTDKNGNKIWENDIIIYKEIHAIGKVAFMEDTFVLDDEYDGKQYINGMWDKFEVIGNIFDNPELAEGGV